MTSTSAGTPFTYSATPEARLEPSYVAGFLPGLILGGVGAGLIQAPLFAAASTLPADRSTTGSAVLTMARQVGSAVGVAALVALLGAHPHSLALFHRGWIFEIIAATGAAAAVLFLRSRAVSVTPSRTPG